MRIIRGPALAGLALAVAALSACNGTSSAASAHSPAITATTPTASAPATSTAPAGVPAGCAVLLRQVKAYDDQLQREAKAYDTAAELATTSAFELDLRGDATAPGTPLVLVAAENDLAAALASFNGPGVTYALSEVKRACGVR